MKKTIILYLITMVLLLLKKKMFRINAPYKSISKEDVGIWYYITQIRKIKKNKKCFPVQPLNSEVF